MNSRKLGIGQSEDNMNFSGICWYCHWGWSKPVAEIYLAAVEKLGGDDIELRDGISHVIWEDENFHLAESQLEKFDSYQHRTGIDELAIVKWSLEELVKIPLDIRCPEPDDYEGENPQDYPPKDDVKMVKVR